MPPKQRTAKMMNAVCMLSLTTYIVVAQVEQLLSSGRFLPLILSLALVGIPVIVPVHSPVINEYGKVKCRTVA